ncbi:MAG: hypothetical protein DPW11_02625 [bacterium]|nr:methyltransferase domain-containing protein [Anaerolineales bacterium]MCQ3944646.1 hypothetical protein [bacterium]
MKKSTYESIYSTEALSSLEDHYGSGSGLYKMWASPHSIITAILFGWEKSDHPAQLHHAWDIKKFKSLNEAIKQSVREALKLLELPNNVDNPNILEAGCGIGGCTTQLAKENPHITVTGISLIQKQIEIANKLKRTRQTNSARFLVGNYLRMPIASDTYNGIFAIETFCHIPPHEKPSLFEEMFRVLKPECKLVIFDGYPIREPQGSEKILFEKFKRGWTLPEMITPFTLTTYAQKAGFKVISVKDITPRVIDSTPYVYRNASILRQIIKAIRFLDDRKVKLPYVDNLFKSLGFSTKNAEIFIEACQAGKPLVESGLGKYYMHVLEKPNPSQRYKNKTYETFYPKLKRIDC